MKHTSAIEADVSGFDFDGTELASFPSEAIGLVLAHIGHDCRPEAGEAISAGVPCTWIDYANRAGGKQTFGESLRSKIACRIAAVCKVFKTADIMKITAKVGEIVVVREALFLPADFGQFKRFMKCDFRLRGFQFESGVPGTAIWPIETAACRLRMAEGRVDHPVVRYTKDQFMRIDARQQIVFTKQAIVCCMVEIENGGKIVISTAISARTASAPPHDPTGVSRSVIQEIAGVWAVSGGVERASSETFCSHYLHLVHRGCPGCDLGQEGAKVGRGVGQDKRTISRYSKSLSAHRFSEGFARLV